MPVFNEEELLPELFRRMASVLDSIEHLGYAAEWIVVNDGSRDRTLAMLESQTSAEPRLTVISLSRNFGHQPAIQAGLEHASGDAIVIMDADLQDPPELIPELITSWRAGNKVVVAKRRARAEGGIKGLLFKTFHAMLGKVSDLKIETDAGVFGLMDRAALKTMIAMPERNRFLPGLRSWVGFQQGLVYYEREGRAAGAPKQTFGRLVKYALDAVFSFSYKPLRAIWTLGFFVSAWSIIYALYLIVLRILQVNVVAGFTTPTVAILFLGGVQLISVGVLGEYLGRIYDEVKQRPLFVIDRVISSKPDDQSQ